MPPSGAATLSIQRPLEDGGIVLRASIDLVPPETSWTLDCATGSVAIRGLALPDELPSRVGPDGIETATLVSSFGDGMSWIAQFHTSRRGSRAFESVPAGRIELRIERLGSKPPARLAETDLAAGETAVIDLP